MRLPHDPALAGDLANAIRTVRDFPKPGVSFKDITPVLAAPELFGRTVAALAAPWRGEAITHVLGVESRGFIFGAPAALALGAAFVPVRKPGKLPRERLVEAYALEYGNDQVELHVDAIGPGSRVVVVDDVLASGGTAAATCRLAERTGATVVGVSVVIDLSFLPWRTALAGRRVEAVVAF